MPEIDREMCRKAAAECVELARTTADPEKKQLLLMRAQEWLKLAYAKNEAEFEQVLADMNDAQMTPMQRVPMQQQPAQQQQAKSEPEDK